MITMSNQGSIYRKPLSEGRDTPCYQKKRIWNDDWYPDPQMLSECCGALSCTEIVNGAGRCSNCKELANFESELKE